MTDQIFTIGQVAKETGIGIETIRYYERMKLMPQPKRSSSGYRQYCPRCVQRLKFIKNAKELGFSLKEISSFLSLRVKDKSKCADVKKRTDYKIEEINEKIKRLQEIKCSLKRLSNKCINGNAPLSQCPILEEFNS
jgi:MerR family mercuric resistance operon transcriptional regulator